MDVALQVDIANREPRYEYVAVDPPDKLVFI